MQSSFKAAVLALVVAFSIVGGGVGLVMADHTADNNPQASSFSNTDGVDFGPESKEVFVIVNSSDINNEVQANGSTTVEVSVDDADGNHLGHSSQTYSSEVTEDQRLAVPVDVAESQSGLVGSNYAYEDYGSEDKSTSDYNHTAAINLTSNTEEAYIEVSSTHINNNVNETAGTNYTVELAVEDDTGTLVGYAEETYSSEVSEDKVVTATLDGMALDDDQTVTGGVGSNADYQDSGTFEADTGSGGVGRIDNVMPAGSNVIMIVGIFAVSAAALFAALKVE